jgi:hypothetical protein
MPDPDEAIRSQVRNIEAKTGRSMAEGLAQGFGADVRVSPKQTYVALRRSKQFAIVGPASGGRVEIGLRYRGVRPGLIVPGAVATLPKFRVGLPVGR